MNPARIWSLVACFALAGVAWAAEPAAAELPVSVTLVRAPCDDFCPGYTVSISSDGTVVFDGREWVTWQGVATKKVPATRLAPLLQKLRDINFWQIDGQGVGRVMLPNGTVTLALPPNRPVYSVTVFQGDKSKQLQGITGGRYAEGDLPEIIDQVADIADWIKRSNRRYGDPASARVMPLSPTNRVPTVLPLPPPAAPAIQPEPMSPASHTSLAITALVAASGKESTVISPGQAPTLVGATADGGSVITPPGQPPSQVVRTPGGGRTIITPGEAATTIVPVAGGGSVITPPGRPPSTVVPTPGGGSTIYTPGEAPTIVVPISGGGSIIYAPGQPPVTVMPTN
jgi:hypothetical protein